MRPLEKALIALVQNVKFEKSKKPFLKQLHQYYKMIRTSGKNFDIHK